MAQIVHLKRAYDPDDPADGYRVYIDRLWPRGLSHATFRYDLWDKELAPSTELREWFHQAPDERWPEFERRYRAELLAGEAFARFKDEIAGHPVVTLLFSSRDRDKNNAVVVAAALSSSATQ